MSLFILLLIALAINTIGFGFAYGYNSDKLTDLGYGVTFFVLALVAYLFSPQHEYKATKLLALWMVTVWAVRLSVFLFTRILKAGRDKRFDEVRDDYIKFGQFWLFQAISVWIILLPVMFFMKNPSLPLIAHNYLGLVIWAVGLIIETIADWQKYKFNSAKANKGRFINSGLWAYSRHPNYFGEILVWLGMYIFVASMLLPSQKLIGVLSPLYIAYILIFATGIPKLEEYADQKWGKQKDYQAYKKQTSILVILPPKKKCAKSQP